jgi:hypothetical protein
MVNGDATFALFNLTGGSIHGRLCDSPCGQLHADESKRQAMAASTRKNVVCAAKLLV